MNLTFDEASHTYTLDGLPIPGTTSLLQSLYDFTMVPKDVLAAKQALGTAVHYACQLDDEGDLDEDSVGAELAGYLAAYRRFKAEKQPLVLMNEQPMAHPLYRYAGTVDRVMVIDGWKWVIDLKTAVALYPPVGVQLAAYEHLIRVNRPDFGTELIRGGLKLKPDGTYQLERFKNSTDWPCFLGLLTAHNWKIHAASKY